MKAKERLEEINQRIFYMKRKSGMPVNVLTWEGWKEVTVLFKEDYKYLREQAERVQELKKELEDTVRQEIQYSMRLETQNKRYREALEFYADERNYEERDFGVIKQNAIQEGDKGNTARKALEGEE